MNTKDSGTDAPDGAAQLPAELVLRQIHGRCRKLEAQFRAEASNTSEPLKALILNFGQIAGAMAHLAELGLPSTPEPSHD